jgi:hypothetical protein
MESGSAVFIVARIGFRMFEFNYYTVGSLYRLNVVFRFLFLVYNVLLKHPVRIVIHDEFNFRRQITFVVTFCGLFI